MLKRGTEEKFIIAGEEDLDNYSFLLWPERFKAAFRTTEDKMHSVASKLDSTGTTTCTAIYKNNYNQY